MQKTIYTQQHQRLCELLIEARKKADLTQAEVAAVARGQFVRPATEVPAGHDHYRLRGPDGSLVAIAIPAGHGRLAPDKVLVTAESPAGG